MSYILTEEQVAKSVLAAYDSVALITPLKSKKKPTAEEVEILDSNKKHIEIMLAKDWFVAALTAEQKAELEALI
jgi:valyl-tRNA synthetase